MSNFKELVRLGRDAEVRQTQAGKVVVGFSAAYDLGFGDRKKTEWLDCSAWGERFEKVAPYLLKGSQVVIEGDIGTKEYEGKVKLGLDVRDLRLVGGKPEGQRQDAPKGGGHSRPAANPQSSGDEFIDDIPFLTNRGMY